MLFIKTGEVSYCTVYMFKKMSSAPVFFWKRLTKTMSLSLGLSLGWAGTARGKVRHFRKWEFYAACFQRTRRVYRPGPLPAQAMCALESMLLFTEDRENQVKSSRPIKIPKVSVHGFVCVSNLGCCRDPSRQFFLWITTTSNKFENWSSWKLEIQKFVNSEEKS